MTFSPLCKPTPVTLTELFKVRCLTIAVLITEITGVILTQPKAGLRCEDLRLSKTNPAAVFSM